jgi:hypothetical protein
MKLGFICLKTRATIGVAEADLGLYQSCGIEYRSGVSVPRCPPSGLPVTYDQPGVAARIAHKQTGVDTSLDKLTATTSQPF